GRYFETGSLTCILPSSTSIMAATDTIGLVMEYMRKIESGRIGSVATRSRKPKVLVQAILPRRATSITAPGTSPESTYFWVVASMRASWLDDRPTSSGAAATGSTGSAQLPTVAARIKRADALDARMRRFIH